MQMVSLNNMQNNPRFITNEWLTHDVDLYNNYLYLFSYNQT